MQTPIPCLAMRRDPSCGPCFPASDMPWDIALRERGLRVAMGSPGPRQIGDPGRAHSLTSKRGTVSPDSRFGVDLDLLFAQRQADKDPVDLTTPRALTFNMNMQCDIAVPLPGGRVSDDGGARIDGASHASAYAAQP